jgi:hypothetical protein
MAFMEIEFKTDAFYHTFLRPCSRDNAKNTLSKTPASNISFFSFLYSSRFLWRHPKNNQILPNAWSRKIYLFRDILEFIYTQHLISDLFSSVSIDILITLWILKIQSET